MRAGSALLRAGLGSALAGIILIGIAQPGAASDAPPLASARVDEQLGAQVPLDVRLRDPQGRSVAVGDLLGPGPTLLVLGYYRCEMLCEHVFGGLAQALADLESEEPATAREPFRVVSVSIDPRDAPGDARRRQRRVVADLDWSPERWPFLVGEQQAVSRIVRRIGFGYRYEPRTDQYAHPAVLTVLTPDGRVSSYLYGIEFSGTQLARALDDARAGHTRSTLQQVLLRCFHYVPALRQFAEPLQSFFRFGAMSIVVALLGGFVLLRRLERARRQD